MATITDLYSRIIFNSRGNETIEIDVITDGKHLGRVALHQAQVLEHWNADHFP